MKGSRGLKAQGLARRTKDWVPVPPKTNFSLFQSCSRYQLNQLGSKAASESTFDQKL